MKEFPTIFNTKQKKHFPDIYFTRVLCYLRREIYEHVLNQDENNYFDIEKFSRKYYKNNKDRDKIMLKLSNSIIQEIENFGWKCKLSFGGTALFIYSSEKPPPSCWDDGL